MAQYIVDCPIKTFYFGYDLDEANKAFDKAVADGYGYVTLEKTDDRIYFESIKIFWKKGLK